MSRSPVTLLWLASLVLAFAGLLAETEAGLPRRLLSQQLDDEGVLSLRALMNVPEGESKGAEVSGKDVSDKARGSIASGNKELSDKVGGSFNDLKNSVGKGNNKPDETPSGKPDTPAGKPDGAPSGGKPDDSPSGKPDGTPSGKPDGIPSGKPDGAPGKSSGSGDGIQRRFEGGFKAGIKGDSDGNIAKKVEVSKAGP